MAQAGGCFFCLGDQVWYSLLADYAGTLFGEVTAGPVAGHGGSHHSCLPAGEEDGAAMSIFLSSGTICSLKHWSFAHSCLYRLSGSSCPRKTPSQTSALVAWQQ